jgi:hypothetical protein
MNAKLAKKLRKIATSAAVIIEQNGQTVQRVAYVTNENGTVSLCSKSWKGAYNYLKKGVTKIKNTP